MLKSLLLAIAIACPAVGAHAQERPRTVGGPAPEEVVSIRTRVVFLDALVKDRRTNEPVRGLRPEHFQVLDDGRPRPLTYFTREGDSRRPLALLLLVDLWSMYGRAHLKSEAALSRLNSALSKLAPEDEAALMTTWVEEGRRGEPVPSLRMVSDFTRDRAATAAALLSLPRLVGEQERLLEELASKGARPSHELRYEIIWRLSDIAGEVTALTRRFPHSRFVVVGLIDDLFDLRKGEREEVTASALRAGITFNALVFKKGFGARLLFGTFNKLFMRPRGLSVHAADELARQTGGDVAQVGGPQDMADGLSRFIDDVLARYSLGFTLGESEPDDDRLHALTVKVTARDARGRERRLTVRARRGYYASRP